MKRLFAHCGQCYWLVISNLEELIDAASNFKATQTDLDVYFEILLKGKVIFLNEAGGYHDGQLEDKGGFFVSSRFPTGKDRIDYLNAKLDIINNRIEFYKSEEQKAMDVIINNACTISGMTRDEVLSKYHLA